MQLAKFLSRSGTLIVATLVTLLILILLAQASQYHSRSHHVIDSGEIVIEADAEGQIGGGASGSGQIAGLVPTEEKAAPTTDDVDWSRFAYVQYITNVDYLCNSVMIFESLHRLGSKAARVMMYPSYMLDAGIADQETLRARLLLLRAKNKYRVKLVPIQIQHRDNSKDDTWDDSYTKLLAFNQTNYDRVMHIDSDALVLQAMDELFLLPPTPIAMPRAYWFIRGSPPKKILSSQLMVIQPSEVEFSRIMDKISTATEDEYDMEIINKLYLDSALVIPHRQYQLLTGEYRKSGHKSYFGNDYEEWDAKAVAKEAKYVHFSDWPLPKPWLDITEEQIAKNQPKCKGPVEREGDCSDREVWWGFYDQFRRQRKVACAVNA